MVANSHYNMSKVISIIIAATLCLNTAVRAGEISQELRTKINSVDKNQPIRVWIKLPRAENPQQLKSSVNAAFDTREGRYGAAYGRLKSTHQKSQQGVLARLNQLQKTGKCAKIKPSWLANIVEVEIAAGELESLAARKDIETIYTIPMLTSIKPTEPEPGESQGQSGSATVEPNLTFIKAPQAWALGFKGTGRVVCSFDTGIEGGHPAYASKWKGLDGDSSAAWFDGTTYSKFPNPVLGDNHGTHTMGILVGSSGADTVGVAINAKWISAAVVDIFGASYIDAFEWAANPDGDPNSVGDVPDVINHSWGIIGIGCMEIFYEFIDNLEALGIVNVFAAGNDGPGAMTIRNPANGSKSVSDSLTCFAVGNVSATNPPVVQTGSSRGPSNCNGAIKPNVCAPGLGIRSANIGGGYSTSSGTSMATPHVAGLVALLRQKNPNATVDQIKIAILTSTQFRPSPLNNNIGWGVIDCLAALNALSGTNLVPNVRVYTFDHNPILPGSSVGGKIALQNLGSAVTALTASIIGTNPSIAVIDGNASFGAIAANGIVTATDSIRVNISGTVAEGTILSMDLRITNGTTFTDTVKIYFPVEPLNRRSFLTHNRGLIQMDISNYGTFGFGPGSFVPIGGAGFTYNGGVNDLFEAGLMIGYDSIHISDGVRNPIAEPDGDFRVVPGGNIAMGLPGAGTSQKTSARFDDSRAENPIGVDVRQFTYTLSEPTLDDIVIMRFLITNTNAFTVNNIFAGLYLDWDIFIFSQNAGGYDAAGGVLWMAYNDGFTTFDYRGTAVLNGTNAGAFTAPASQVYFPGGFTEREKDSSLGAGFSSAAAYTNVELDLFQVVSAGPLNLTAGETKVATFAILAGSTLTDLENSVVAAANINDSLINTCCNGLRGNVNNDGLNVSVLDLTYMIDDIFRGGPSPVCPQEADLNADGVHSAILDLTYLIDFIFRGGNDPVSCPGY